MPPIIFAIGFALVVDYLLDEVFKKRKVAEPEAKPEPKARDPKSKTRKSDEEKPEPKPAA